MTDGQAIIEIESHSVEQTMAIGKAVAEQAQPGDLVALIGELGAGKTQFVRGMAMGLNIDPSRVSSPTFVFLQEYDSTDADAPVLAHVDAYRLSGSDDLATIGWEGDGEELRSGAILVVEWADRIPDALGNDYLEVRITHDGDGRTLTFRSFGKWDAHMQELRQDFIATIQSCTE